MSKTLKLISFATLIFLLIQGCTVTPTQTQILAQTPTPTAQVPIPHTTVQTPSTVPLQPTATTFIPAASPSPSIPPLPALSEFAGMGGVELSAPEQIETVAQAGAGWVRYFIDWSAIEPAPGNRNWEAVNYLENALKQSSSLGVRFIFVIDNTPAWALKPGYNCGPVSIDQFPAMVAFFQDLIKRYSKSPYNVHDWELWNEEDAANFLGCWGNPGDPYYGGGYYASMLKQAYPAMKTVDPQAQVLVGGLLLDCDPINPPAINNKPGQFRDCSSSKFLEGILQQGGGDFFDGISFHAYDYYYGGTNQYGNPNWNSAWNTTGPALIAKVKFIRDVLAKYNQTDKYLMDTELAIICGKDGTEPVCQSNEFNTAKTNYVALAIATSKAEGLKSTFWYCLRGWRASQLVDSNLQPLSAFKAFQFSAKEFGSAEYKGDITQFAGTKGYEFSLNGERLWFLWSLDGANHSILLPSMPSSVNNVYGDKLSNAQQIVVTSEPIYITLAH